MWTEEIKRCGVVDIAEKVKKSSMYYGMNRRSEDVNRIEDEGSKINKAWTSDKRG